MSYRFLERGGWFSSVSPGTAEDLRAARLGLPVRGVLDLATADAADGRGLGVTADFFRGARFFMGVSPLTPRARRMSASSFPSDGTKMLQ